MTTAKSGPWATAGELMWQLRDIRGKCPNSGYSFYSASCFNKIKAPLADSLQKNFNRYPALVPPMTWLDNKAPAAPALKASGNKLEWHTNNPAKEPLRYVVYRFAANEKVDLERNDRIISIQQESTYRDANAAMHKNATYVVTALDRVWNESDASNTVKM